MTAVSSYFVAACNVACYQAKRYKSAFIRCLFFCPCYFSILRRFL